MTETDPLPTGWQRNRVARITTRVIGGREVTVMEGVDVVRHCGCMMTLATRLDKNEPVAGAMPCLFHEAHVRRALDYMTTTSPQDIEVGRMFAESLERELALSPA